MPADPISYSYLAELLGQLCAALGKPFGAKGEKMVAMFHRAVEGWSPEAIEWGVWELGRTWKADKFPKPAHLVEMCAKSGKPRLELERDPDLPTEPEIERCHECREWWAYHRVVSRLVVESGLLIVVDGIRHADGCARQRSERRQMGLYRWTYVDAAPQRGQLDAGAQAWHPHTAVFQLLPDPLPETAAQYRAKREAAEGPHWHHSETVRRRRRAYDAPRAPAPITAALPAALAATEQGKLLGPGGTG
jgi:hypothetical protein